MSKDCIYKNEILGIESIAYVQSDSLVLMDSREIFHSLDSKNFSFEAWDFISENSKNWSI